MKHSIQPSMLALLSGVSLLGSSTASAAVFNVSATNIASPGLQTLNFAQFNSALGTLTGVTFTLDSQGVGLAATVNGSFSSGEGGTASALTSATFDIDGPSGQLFLGNGSAIATCNVPSGSFCNSPTDSTTPPVFSPLIVMLTAPPNNLAPYIGASFFDVFVELDVSTNVQTCTAPFGGPASCSSTGSASWRGTVDVNYTFIPAGAVPEPMTLGLMGLGLAGLGFARRKK